MSDVEEIADTTEGTGAAAGDLEGARAAIAAWPALRRSRPDIVAKIIAAVRDHKERSNASAAFHSTFQSLIPRSPDLKRVRREEVDAIVRHVFGIPAWCKPVWDMSYEEAEDAPVLADVNAEYAVAHMGSDVAIVHERTDLATGHAVVDFVTTADLKIWFANRFVEVKNEKGEKKKRPLFDHWVKSPARRSYSAVVFEPHKPGDPRGAGDLFNLWRGWAIEPDARGERGCRLFLDHLREIVCGGDEGHFLWLTAWLADAVQNPAARPGTSVVLRGGQGAGKSIVGTYVGKMYGAHYVYLGDRQQLAGRFNKALQYALMVLGDEVIFGGDRQSANKLKSIVTEPTIMIEPKFVDAFPVRNHARLILATNEESVMPTGHDDRRYFMPSISGARVGDAAYFDALADEMRDGGPACLLHYLATFDLNAAGMNLRVAPATEEKATQIELSETPVQSFWRACLQRGEMVDPEFTKGGPWEEGSVIVSRGALYRAYIEHARDIGRRDARLSETSLWKTIDEMSVGTDGKRLLARTKRQYQFPDWKDQDGGRQRKGRAFSVKPIADCRAAYDRWAGRSFPWDEYDTEGAAPPSSSNRTGGM